MFIIFPTVSPLIYLLVCFIGTVFLQETLARLTGIVPSIWSNNIPAVIYAWFMIGITFPFLPINLMMIALIFAGKVIIIGGIDEK